jgi:hypothetical protein
MCNWRKILSWRIQKLAPGSRVRLKVRVSKTSFGLSIPSGITGTVVLLDNVNSVWVKLDWHYPTPYDAREGPDNRANKKGWNLDIADLELI